MKMRYDFVLHLNGERFQLEIQNLWSPKSVRVNPSEAVQLMSVSCPRFHFHGFVSFRFSRFKFGFFFKDTFYDKLKALFQFQLVLFEL